MSSGSRQLRGHNGGNALKSQDNREGFRALPLKAMECERFCKRQQMQWTKRGTHLLLQTRVKTLNQELGAVFQQWYPDLQLEEEPLAA